MLLSIIVFLLIGLLAGWLAGLVTRGYGFGLFGNILIGVVGALIGGLVFPALGLNASGFIGEVLFAAGGAILLLLAITLLRRL